MMERRTMRLLVAAAVAAAGIAAGDEARASSHMDAPLVTFDDPANTTDVYAFVSERDGEAYLSTALSVYPFEEPGIGPNNYRFDDNVRYEIHVATGKDLQRGEPTFTYQFEFSTVFADDQTILQHYTDVVQPVSGVPGEIVFADGQNMRQTYTVRRIENVKSKKGKKAKAVTLGKGMVPPNNQGLVTPFYNQSNDGSQPAREGVATAVELDPYTRQAIAPLADGHVSFAGQRDDGFYADIQAIFDGLNFRSAEGDSFDSQGGFNVHTIVLDIPLEEIGGSQQVVGVWATTSRRQIQVLSRKGGNGALAGEFVQVARQGNPLFCEGLVAIEDKDRYNRTQPSSDAKLFAKYANEPELARLINARLGAAVLAEDRSDLVAIFIPDVIKVDLSTGPARLAGSGGRVPSNPDDADFSRLGVFGNDLLVSQVQPGFFGNGTLPGGWPNGRRFGDDVVDIAVSAIFSDLRDPLNPVLVPIDGIDNVDLNDIGFNKVFPYAATPQNGRNHPHH